jgi:hypothetical protein
MHAVVSTHAGTPVTSTLPAAIHLLGMQLSTQQQKVLQFVSTHLYSHLRDSVCCPFIFGAHAAPVAVAAA